MKSILIILSLIIIVFFLSEDKKLNKIMKKQSIPFIIILSLFYLFFNKIDIRIVGFVSIITLITCSNIFSNSKTIIENLKLIGENKINDIVNNAADEDNDEDHADVNHIDDIDDVNDVNDVNDANNANNVGEDLHHDSSEDIKEAFNYEELHGMFKDLDQDINNK
tara:strand:+ start:12106 stop:12600 length:495 start_codon:yes stop_codon:yes gene_type:complete